MPTYPTRRRRWGWRREEGAPGHPGRALGGSQEAQGAAAGRTGRRRIGESGDNSEDEWKQILTCCGADPDQDGACQRVRAAMRPDVTETPVRHNMTLIIDRTSANRKLRVRHNRRGGREASSDWPVSQEATSDWPVSQEASSDWPVSQEASDWPVSQEAS
ncbi:unnamed protein product [Boreogadus saida]